MSFAFLNPTQLFFSNHCVVNRQGELKQLGERALVVTGKASAKQNGSLDDVEKCLNEARIAYQIYSGVEPDPGFETILKGVAKGIQGNVDMVIGVGGGSAIDAAKAIAILLANRKMAPEELFSLSGKVSALPVVAIPTTAGTGTEVTPYGVLTDTEKKCKRVFRHPCAFPRIALVDAVYTLELPQMITMDTAVDALSHLLEGYISNKANIMTDTLAEKGLQIFWECMAGLEQADVNRGVREKLMLASTLGGMVIATAGTATVHALGFPLTVYHDIPHGRANGYLLTSQMKRCAAVTSKANRILRLLRLEHWDAFELFLNKLLPPKVKLAAKELKQYAAQASLSKNHENNPYPITEALLLEILQENFH